ncbi:amine oxidase [Azorhizobium oxalatiphilum]|uniref:Tryptophan 2-monooxygenase n=1 Tax=Azorhizobium oxalatiphilum TaxID=980631 RepID=A0A917CDQ7_9HYPH|nr:FAD-dependent oxidoreductase [Azorhizobium oxalatiphilum]GGF81530.1 amine oxidase [Azorhizobium oxalatiphilum]
MSAAFSRRALLAGAFSLPAFAHALGQTSGQVDVVIVGAGAAGIAAARRVAAAGRSYALIEAGKRVGGRTSTDTAAFGVPFDLGARRLHAPAGLPLAELGRQAGLELYAAPRGARLYQGLKEAGDTAYEDFVAATRRAERAIGAAGDAGRDLPAARVLPPDLGPYGPLATFLLGPLRCARELDQVSTVDFSRADDRDEALLSRAGLGTLVAKLAEGLNVRLETAATAVDYGPRNVEVRTARGTLTGRAVILAVPPSLFSAGKIRISPGLPTRQRSAIERIPLGHREHVAFLLPGNPLGAQPDETLLVQGAGARTLVLNARIGGSDLHVMELGGKAAQALTDGKDNAGADYVRAALQAEFGADVGKRMGKSIQTRWSKDPLTLGGISCALPGSGNMRRAFTEVVANRLIFAGEHAHETLWGTVAGAWLSGERAAGQALRFLGVQGAALER